MDSEKFVQWFTQISQLLVRIQHELHTLQGHGPEIEHFLDEIKMNKEWFILYNDALKASHLEVSTALGNVNSILIRLGYTEDNAA